MRGIKTTSARGLGRQGIRLATPIGAVAVIAFLLLGSGAAAACQTPPSTSPPYTVLDKIPLVDAIAANSTMVFAQGVTHCSQIWAITPSDHVSLYATVPVPTGVVCSEGGLALAPNTTFVGHLSSGSGTGGLAGAPFAEVRPVADGGHNHCRCSKETSNTTLFAVGEGQLYAITQNGTNVTWVANFSVPNKVTLNMGLAYDQVGLFHHDLIVTSSFGGKVWLVNSTGNVTLLASLNTYIGNPAVAPLNFGAFGGQIIIPEHQRNTIVAVSSTGKVTHFGNWTYANAVAFPPYSASGHRHHHGGWTRWNGGLGGGQGGIAQWGHGGGGPCRFECSFGPQHFVLFVANYSSGAVEAFPAKDLRGFYGDGFVAGGVNAGIGAFNSSGNFTYFATQTRSLSGIASVYCPPPPPCRGERNST